MNRRENSATLLKKTRQPAVLFGLLVRKEKWAISMRGRIVLLVVVLFVGTGFFFGIHPFLAVTQPVDTSYLVVEGWVPNYALQESLVEFKSRPYSLVFTVGADSLTQVDLEGNNLAIGAAKRLQWLGLSAALVQSVPAQTQYRDRTFQSAVALRKWLEKNKLSVSSLNVLTLGAHARRSRLLFEKAFDGKVNIGIISVENRQYNARHWWKYSAGVREVMAETISYLYARFLFHPSKTQNLDL